ncbi:MAG: diadenosine tetraphosphate hydrolase, partial [Actinomycetota bacterium]|nr:diadenosine tetraphosphate hydrolase [Actinomycetota bacterium]
AQQAAFSPERVGLIIAGYEVPHTHIHVLPTNEMSDLSFSNAATGVDREDLERAATAIHRHLVAAGHDTGVTR